MKKWTWVLSLVATLLCVMAVFSLGKYIVRSTGNSRERAEDEHGIVLPPSASKIQCRGDGWLRKTPISGGFVTTMFEMNPAETSALLSPLHIRSRNGPAVAIGDPLVNGWNVWPQKSPTFIPGNAQGGGWQRTWTGAATPVEMVSCDSPEGMFLHLEFWKLDSGLMLVKMCTVWED
jgi:hypothetical protein